MQVPQVRFNHLQIVIVPIYTLTCDTSSASNDCSDAESSVVAPNTPSPIVSSSGVGSPGIDSSQSNNCS